MEGITTEIRSKIKAAVKAKLQELGVHVDEELPDYILVMVANRRSKVQMCSDLSLFLGPHTESFTDWLHLVFQKLETFTTTAKEPVAKEEIAIAPDKLAGKIPNYSQPATLQLDTTDKEQLIPKRVEVYQPSHVPVISSSVKSMSQSHINSPEEMDDDCLNIRDEQDQEPISKLTYEPPNKGKTSEKRHLNYTKEGRTARKTRQVTSDASPKQLSSRIGSVVRPVFKTQIPRRSSKTSEHKKENDKDSQRYGSQHRNGMPSVVRVTSRPKLPAKMQANKSLILKAVAAAQKSVGLYQPKTVEPKINPRPELFTRKYRERKLVKPENDTVSSIPNRGVAIIEDPPAKNEVDASFSAMDVDTCPEPTEVQCTGRSEIDSPDRAESPVEVPSPTIETRFIVTLDGVHSHLGNKFGNQMEEGDDDDDDIENFDVSHPRELKSDVKSRLSRRRLAESELKTQQCLERCKYWPGCRQGARCSYHHPNVPCKTFPNCTFGDSCLFIHPNCKYDASCSRKNCMFTHATKPKTGVSVPTPDTAPPPINGKTVCKFFPSCNNVNCIFFHPLACKFGSNCTRGGCSFYHPNVVPSIGQLKWIANK